MPIIINNGLSVNYLSELSPNDFRFEKWRSVNSEFSLRFSLASQYLLSGCDLFLDYFISDKEKKRLANVSLKNSKNLSSCSPSLTFSHDVDSNSYHLKDSFFCRSRFCPLCNWRRRLKLGYRFYNYLLPLSDKYQILFFTATIPNSPLWRLRSSCDILTKSYNTLFGLGAKAGTGTRNKGLFDKTYHLGSFRNIEITRRFTSLDPEPTYEYNGIEKYYYSDHSLPPCLFDYHPHIHAILLFDKNLELPPHNCFGTDNQNNWVSLWAKALLKSGLDYPLFYKGLESGDPKFLPSVRVRVVGSGGSARKRDLTASDSFQEASLKSDIYECCKYGFDVAKFRNDSDKLIDKFCFGGLEGHLSLFADQVFNYRFLATYGLLRGISLDDENLINVNEDSAGQVSSSENLKSFYWSKKHNHYLLSS